mmetsp:Transcript_35325/g.59545  ORF Transcript_35325/g.59545 Transcript_35325/m.59545 type:complete len:163 (-) Transcript_35325:69-557(-)
MAFMLTPPRHGSLDRFADITRQTGLETLLEEEYDEVVWAKHERLLAAVGTPAEGWSAYEAETCFPLLLQIRWPQQLVSGWVRIAESAVGGLVTLYLGLKLQQSIVRRKQRKSRREMEHQMDRKRPDMGEMLHNLRGRGERFWERLDQGRKNAQEKVAPEKRR